jgi:hypothetical protein
MAGAKLLEVLAVRPSRSKGLTFHAGKCLSLTPIFRLVSPSDRV